MINFLQRHVEYRDNKYSHFQLDFGIPERTDVKKDILCSDLCAKHIFLVENIFFKNKNSFSPGTFWDPSIAGPAMTHGVINHGPDSHNTIVPRAEIQYII